MKGATRLRAALRRFTRPLRRPKVIPDRPPPPNDPWAQAVEDRLTGVENKLGSQNRLLLIAIVTMIADIAYRELRP